MTSGPLVWIWASWVEVRRLAWSLLATSTWVPLTSTVTTSLIVPTASLSAPSSTVLLALTTLCVRSRVWNPVSSTRTLYVPGGTARNLKAPPGSEVRVRETSEASFVSVTVAPGTGWPWLSATVPDTVPVTCAHAEPAASSTTTRAIDPKGTRLTVNMHPPEDASSGPRSFARTGAHRPRGNERWRLERSIQCDERKAWPECKRLQNRMSRPRAHICAIPGTDTSVIAFIRRGVRHILWPRRRTGGRRSGASMNAASMWALVGLTLGGAGATTSAAGSTFDLAAFERARVRAAADRDLAEAPRTITAATSPRSAGGPHDFFSEGDYWWPDPKNPDGPYVQRDGMTNPDNFVEHRRALMRLSVQVPTLAAAWRLTGNPRYAAAAGRHLRAWFLDPATRMAPHLRYAQAIHGITTGRPQGVIDTLHLVEVARAIEALDGSPALSAAEREGVRGWFRDYLAWLTTDENALKERDARNNHAT